MIFEGEDWLVGRSVSRSDHTNNSLPTFTAGFQGTAPPSLDVWNHKEWFTLRLLNVNSLHWKSLFAVNLEFTGFSKKERFKLVAYLGRQTPPVFVWLFAGLHKARSGLGWPLDISRLSPEKMLPHRVVPTYLNLLMSGQCLVSLWTVVLQQTLHWKLQQTSSSSSFIVTWMFGHSESREQFDIFIYSAVTWPGPLPAWNVHWSVLFNSKAWKYSS